MNKIQFGKCKNRVEEIKKILDNNLLYTQDNLVNDGNLAILLNFRISIRKDIFNFVTRLSKYYIEVIIPLIESIKKIEKDKKEEIRDLLKNSDNSKIVLIKLMKGRAIWFIEEVVLDDEELKSLYLSIIGDIDKRGVIGNDYNKKKVIAVDPDGNELIFANAYILKCLKKVEYRYRATSKKNGKIYRFHYEGEELVEPVKHDRKPINKLLKCNA